MDEIYERLIDFRNRAQAFADLLYLNAMMAKRVKVEPIVQYLDDDKVLRYDVSIVLSKDDYYDINYYREKAEKLAEMLDLKLVSMFLNGEDYGENELALDFTVEDAEYEHDYEELVPEDEEEE